MGHIFVLSGASSVGKTTFLKALAGIFNNTQLRILPRHTDRPKRPAETEEFEYHFLSHRQFLEKVYAHDFLHVEKWGKFYAGIDRTALEDAMVASHDSIVLASTFAAARLRASYKTGMTHLYMWTGDAKSLMTPRCMDINSDEVGEIIFRIKKKQAENGFSPDEIENNIASMFAEERMVDNFVDIAAVNGRLRNRENILVLENRRDRMSDAVKDFQTILANTPRDFAVSPQTSKTSGCFVLMPFKPQLDPVYEDHIEPVCKRIGLSSLRADKIFSNNPIIEDIREAVSSAQLIVADLTENNPNVFYEIGVCHALGKQVILTTQHSDIPFDLRHLRCIIYEFNPRGMKAFESKLENTIRNLLEP